MNYYFLLLFNICLFTSGFAQLYTTGLSFDVSRHHQKSSALRLAATSPDTLSLPFLDDFSTSFQKPDSARWLAEGGVYVNNNYAVNPPSVNVATFDGLKDDGFPYVFQTPISGTERVWGDIDYLISKPINLDSNTAADSLGFSFYWQRGSWHSSLRPDLSRGDTLKLFFLDKDGEWVKVWPQVSDTISLQQHNPLTGFDYTFIRITDSAYFHKAFQFKFTSFGVMTGNFSLWSIDYVYLDKDRNTDNIQDFAFGKQLSSFFTNYSAVPYRQFVSSPTSYIADNILSNYNNLSADTNYRDSVFVNMIHLNQQGNTAIYSYKSDSVLPLEGLILAKSSVDIAWTPEKQLIIDAIEGLDTDNIAFEYQLQVTGRDQIELLKTNDEISNTNYLSNYFAYDDGTPEGSIEVRRSGYVKLAYEFEIKETDTLTAIYIYWSRIGLNVAGAGLNIKVWTKLTGIDGVERDEEIASVPTAITYGEEFNKFTKIIIPAKEVKAGKLYVGWEQNLFTSIVKVGADLSKDNRTRFFEFIDGKWRNPDANLFYGTPMIRPKFGNKPALGMDAPVVIGLPNEHDVKKTANFELYPNPADKELTILGDLKTLTIYDMAGKRMYSEQFQEIEYETHFSTDRLPTGLYLLELSNGINKGIYKLVINH